MDPLFEISLFAYLVLRYRARRNRHRNGSVAMRDLIALHDELLGISASLGRGWLDRVVQRGIYRRAVVIEQRLEACEDDRVRARAFSIKQR